MAAAADLAGGGSPPLRHLLDAANTTTAQLPLGGPYSPILDVLFCLAPIAFLLVVTLSQRLFMPTSRSLPLAALMLWVVKMTWIGEDAVHVQATILQGGLLALTPLSILFSAFLFFNALTVTGCFQYAAALVRATCGNHPVAEVFFVLWALGHLIEGASGFGTGPAMLPPIMAALGHPPFESLVCLLIMTTTVGPFGSSGIGLWFGLSALEWGRAALVKVTFLVAICMALMSFPIGLMSARFLLSWEDLRGCWVFVSLSIASCALPALLASLISFEAPGLLSGMLGVIFVGCMARKGLGLPKDVPCMVARRLQQLERGMLPAEIAVAAVECGDSGEPFAAGQPVAEDSSGCGRKREAGGGRVIELTAVSGSQGAAAAVDEHTDAATGLLAALAAMSPVKATDVASYPRPASTLSAPAALGPSASELDELDEAGSEDGAEGGRGELLPSRAVRSHHNLGAYHSGRAALAAVGAGSSGGSASCGAAAPGYAGGAAQPGQPADGGDAELLGDRRQLAWRLAPWAAMLLVVAGTRVPYLQRSNGHELRLHLRSLGDFYLSSNLVLQFKDLCRIGVNWSYALLYVPALLPFICTACATLYVFRSSIPADQGWRQPFRAASTKCLGVAPAIFGALVLVAQMVQGGRQAPSFIIGFWLSEWLGKFYILISMLLGAVGSFMSGSVATSNMTFGLLQQVAAQKLGLNPAGMVMLQIVGGAAGQMVSISNILGGRAVMQLQHIPEGRFIMAALPACAAYYVASTALSLPFLFAGSS